MDGGNTLFSDLGACMICRDLHRVRLGAHGLGLSWTIGFIAALLWAHIAWAEAPRFVDVTAAMGLSGELDGKVAWGDINNDGWVDLYTSKLGGYVPQLWLNNNGNSFSRIPAANLDGMRGLGVWGDYNKDGYLDMFSWQDHATPRLFRNVNGTTFVNESSKLPTFTLPSNMSSLSAAWGDYNGDDYLDIYLGGFTDQDVLLINNKDGTFKNAWQSPHFLPGRGMTAADWDQDGDMDVYVSNYNLALNQLWRNNGSGNDANLFADAASSHNALGGNGPGSSGHTIGSVFGDLDNDGLVDLFVGNFAHPGQPEPKFLRNLGPASDYAFENKCSECISYQESFSSATLGDVDNDGWLDLFFATIYPPSDMAQLYMNGGGVGRPWNFDNRTVEAGLSGLQVQYEAAFADYDNDGDLDLMTKGKLFENPGNANHYLKVALDGAGIYGATAIGAQVRVQVGGMTITRIVSPAVGEGNQNDPRLNFGLGNYSGPLTLIVTWPDGTVQVETVTEVDQIITLSRGPVSSQWAVDDSGDWSSGANWVSGSAAGGVGASATFGDVITSPRTVFMEGDRVIGSIAFESPYRYTVLDWTVTGSLTVAAESGAARISATRGRHEFSANVVVASDLDVDVAAWSAITFSATLPLSLNGHTLIKTGNGSVQLHNVEGGGNVQVQSGELIIGGTHFGGGQYTVDSAGTLSGDGLLLAGVVNSGTVAPGASVGGLTVLGSYSQEVTGLLEMEIGGTTAVVGHDVLSVGGALIAAGTLKVLLADGHQPELGNEYGLLSFGTATGTFTTLDLPTLATGLMWNSGNLLSTGVLAVGSGALYGDANNDGLVSGLDLIAVQQNFGAMGLDDGWLMGDADDNGSVTGADLIVVQQNFGVALSVAVVPEPVGSLVIVVGVFTAFLRCGQGRR